ncbi:3',5'-cyclic-nucleotide phosphodiesterase [Mucilaginibacter roseus]|uniref:3',5'-cyclic-nucleotide phosphodiesterase n=1 Tax=Mucilaginibacter roseus TaxID=1528868 RepID=A0ABS8U6Q4_9SPHI|nr:3',5'-cyclic-nucleotide phosphodiesterase [Mucilaginibacter roseus]MCD8741768.1 3',5'-cyclic-nucleotide phosphodiesterase [Mucilaginibacter roseus]
MPCRFLRFITLYLAITIPATAQTTKPSFNIVPLGVKGGIDESNLSAYMVGAAGSEDYICLDAGTLHYGIEKAVSKHTFKVSTEQVLKRYIKGYFISHAHLDHVSGLIINSPEDSLKSIYGLASCLETLKTHYFTWASWANFTDEGEKPQLKKYSYKPMEPGKPVTVDGTGLTVQVFPLSHSNLTGAAYLIKNNNAYVLYLGDTGPDEVEKSDKLRELWQAVGPLISKGQLKAILIEVSYPNEQPDKSLFGHLTPNWLMKEMKVLESYTGIGKLKNFNLVITHVKPPQQNINKLKQQLKQQNTLGLNLIFPQQGKAIRL